MKALAERYGLTNYSVYDNYDKAIEEVECDVVDICLPNFLHHDVAIKAFKKGRHVVSEKPLATTVEDGKKWFKQQKKQARNCIMLKTGFCPALNKAMEIVNEGAIGKPLYIRSRECHGGSHSPLLRQ